MCRTKSTVSTVNSSDKPDAFLGTVRSVEKGKPWMVDLEVNNRNLKFKMDTGADVTVLPLKQYDETKDGQLKFPTRNLYGSDRRILPTKGAINATISKHGRTLSNRVIYVMEGLDTPLLGRSVIEDLNLIARLHTVNTTKQSITERYSELFQGLGEMEGEYEIRLKDEVQPFVLHTPRRIPLPLLPKVKEELRMQELGVISPLTEPTDWCAGMLVVPKSDGRVRICVDLTRLNKDVQSERHIIPSVEHTLAQLGGAKVFSKLDANSGFWQIKLAYKSSFLTTFITPFGRFRFNRLPFGITSAPEHFQRKMTELLTGLDGVVCMLDDVLIYGKSQEEHDQHLERALESSGVTLNLDKCQFSKTSVRFLGQVIDAQGIRPDPDKLEAIKNM